MPGRRRKWRLLRSAAFAAAVAGCAQTALAQQVPTAPTPSRRVTDARGVDLTSGDMRMEVPLVSFGQGATALNASLDLSPLPPGIGGSTFAQTAGSLTGASLRPLAQITGVSTEQEPRDYENVTFPTGVGFIQSVPILWQNPDNSLNIHTNPDGSKYMHSFGATHFTRFVSTDPNLAGVYDAAGDKGVPAPNTPSTTMNGLELEDKIVFANGEEWRFYRQYATVPCKYQFECTTKNIARVRSIVSSRGYAIQFLYASDVTPSNETTAGSWYGPRRITAYNKAFIYCNEAALVECPAVSALPSAQIDYNATAGTVTVTPPSGKGVVEFTMGNGGVGSIRKTAVANSTVTFLTAVDQTDSPYVSRVTDSAGQWNYTRIVYVDDSGHVPLMSATSTNPLNGQVQIIGYSIFGQLQSYTDELLRRYDYATGFPYRPWDVTEPEGNETWVSGDERNNVTAVTRSPKPNSGLSPQIIYSAFYPVDCTNPRTCNRPIWVKDAAGNETDYTYDPVHGGMLTETLPAVNGVRPQKRYTYQQRTAWVSNGAGGYVASAPIWLLTQMSLCRTGNPAVSGAGCAAGASDEVITAYDYGPNSGPNNLLLRGTVVTADGISLRTCYGFDSLGRKISETSPRAGLASCP